MQTPLVCNVPGVLSNIKLSYTPMSSENTYYSTVRIQDSTWFIIEDSDGTSNFIENQICVDGFSDVFRWKLDAKMVEKYKACQTAA